MASEGQSSADWAKSLVRPSAARVEAAWRDQVRKERLQVERLPNRPRPEDFYQPIAESFRGEPERPDDAVLQQLLGLASLGETWLDLGAGGGRYAVPLSRHVARVLAVEPSEGMRRVLTDAMSRNGIENIDVFAERWPANSHVPVAEVGMIVHVGYDIEPIGSFLDQLEAHSSRLCLAVLFERAPTAAFAALWRAVHGETRVTLPGLREFLTLLLARGALPEVRVLKLPPRTYSDLDAAQRAARRPLWVLAGSEEDRRLAEAIEQTAQAVEGGFAIGEAERRLGIVTWAPGR